jgi:DNA polymerase-3 subunit epsilon
VLGVQGEVGGDRGVTDLVATRRRNAIAWARSVANDPSALFLDTETLGKLPNAGLCDVAIVGVDGFVWLDELVDPGRPIPADATAIHAITDADVAGAPTFAALYPTIRAIVGGRRIVVYNSSFDAAVLDECCDAADLPAFGGASWECAMTKYSDFAGTIDERFATRPSRYGRGRPSTKLKWHKLSAACEAMGVTLDGAHRALADAQACRRLVLAVAEAPA